MGTGDHPLFGELNEYEAGVGESLTIHDDRIVSFVQAFHCFRRYSRKDG